MEKKGQGTIEYLVILAVIVVVSLIVVGLMISSTSGAAGVSSGTSKIGGWTNAISVTESAISPDGNYLVRLANNTGEPLTIKTVSVGDEEVSFSEDLFQGSQQGFKVSSEVVCEIGQTITADLVVTYVSENGLEHTETFPADIAFACDDYVVSLLANQCETCTTYPTQYLSPNSTTLTEGYYDANNLATISDGNLAAGNILDTATIFGITGTASAGGGDPGFGFIEFAAPSYSSTDGGTTVTDSANGLVWQASSYGPGSTLTWQAAMDYCNNNTPGLAGTGWRLPNIAEIGLLYNYSSGAMYGSPFTNNTSFWSSTAVPSCISNAYYLYSYGSIYSGNKANGSSYGVRCVRSE